MAVSKRTSIKQSLYMQLEDMKVVGKHFFDLVDDYMSLWDIKNNLIKDIKTRGVTVEYNNGGGQSGRKKNESIAELNRTNQQMLKILQELGITTKENVADDITPL